MIPVGSLHTEGAEVLAVLGGAGQIVMICVQALAGISEQTTNHMKRFTLCKHL